jgi:hypothetical protein
MKSMADGLPLEIAQQIHPDWRKNEAEYWAVRDELLDKYRNQWIGFAAGRVVASGTRAVVVFHAAHRAADHPFCVCVGRENEPFCMRRATFAFDTSYPGQALPVIRAEFRQSSGLPGTVFDRVIPARTGVGPALATFKVETAGLTPVHAVHGSRPGSRRGDHCGVLWRGGVER